MSEDTPSGSDKLALEAEKGELDIDEEKSSIPFGAIARVPGLALRLGFSALKFKRHVKKSTRKLRKGLIKGGMSRERANELACKYEESLSIRKFIKSNLGDSGLSSIPFFSR